MDPYQARLQPALHLLDRPLKCNPTPKFLGVIFDRTLSFSSHLASIKARFFPRLKALRSIASASWGPSKESLSLLYKAFIRPVLTYASPGWFPFSCATNIRSFERLHNAACRAISGCLTSTPTPLLLLESLQPPLAVTLTHQSLSYFERAMRLPTPFPIAQTARSKVKVRLKTKPSWRSFCLAHSLTPPQSIAREPLRLTPPFHPWAPSLIRVDTFLSEPCSRSDPPPSDLKLQEITWPPSPWQMLWPGPMVLFPPHLALVVQGLLFLVMYATPDAPLPSLPPPSLQVLLPNLPPSYER